MSENSKTVYIVDDDLDLLEQLSMRLRSDGYQVETGESQKDGLALLDKGKPDIAIYDLMMENQDSGFVLSYETKKRYPGVPVIMVTGVAGETGIQFAADTEEEHSWIKADAILNKSIRYEQLSREIRRLLK